MGPAHGSWCLRVGRVDQSGTHQVEEEEDVAGGADWLEGLVGAHHFGFVVDDLDEARKRIEENGGCLYMNLPMSRDSLYFEQKFLYPDAVHFDISHNGWVGTDQVRK